MSFWDWAVKTYARPGVAEACLELQDRHAQSVLYLLWAAWAAGAGRALTPSHLAAGAKLAARWDEAAIRPLREIRRRLKPPFPGLEETAKSALREQIKAVELKAERVLIDALEALAPAAAGAPLLAAQALAAAGAAWPSPAPRPAIETLAQKLA
jgi:uncharacterized protein (TIGR02444 family)